MTIVLSIILRMSNISFVSENGTFGFSVPNCVKSSVESGGLFASFFPVPVTTLLQLLGEKNPTELWACYMTAERCVTTKIASFSR